MKNGETNSAHVTNDHVSFLLSVFLPSIFLPYRFSCL